MQSEMASHCFCSLFMAEPRCPASLCVKLLEVPSQIPTRWEQCAGRTGALPAEQKIHPPVLACYVGCYRYSLLCDWAGVLGGIRGVKTQNIIRPLATLVEAVGAGQQQVIMI